MENPQPSTTMIDVKRSPTSVLLLLAACCAAGLPGCLTAPFLAPVQDAPIQAMPILPGTVQPMLPPAISVPGLPQATMPPTTVYPPSTTYPPTTSYPPSSTYPSTV